MSRQGDVREYEVFEGKNRFCCDGRIVLGPIEDIGFNGCVWTIILVPVSAYYYFVGFPMLWTNPGLVLVVTTFFAWTVITLLLTGCSDPGIIPRQSKGQALEQARQAIRNGIGLTKGSNVQAELENLGSNPPRTLMVEIEGSLVVCKLCPTCFIYRPPRSSHCSDCDNCCLEWDHHCPFVGNCVGQRNYGSFCGFLVCVVALLISVLMSIMMYTADNHKSDKVSKASKSTDLVFIAIIGIYSLIMFFVLGGFSVFHLCLIVSGKTTKERLKSSPDSAGDSSGRTLACCSRPAVLWNPRGFARENPKHKLYGKHGDPDGTDSASLGVDYYYDGSYESDSEHDEMQLASL